MLLFAWEVHYVQIKEVVVNSLLLSKSKYLSGLQCPRYLWVSMHEPEKLPEPDAFTKLLFEQGHLVGELAKQLFPNGVNISVEDFISNVEETRKLIKRNKPLFEAGFLVRINSDQIFARADILNPIDGGQWDIVEVKSSTRIRDIDIQDVSFQKFCYQKAGLNIRKCFLMYINNQYIRHGALDPKQLFNSDDITDKVNEVIDSVEEKLSRMFDIIKSTEYPDANISSQCTDPYDCPLISECWKLLPDDSVFSLYRAGAKAFELYESGISSIRDIPLDFRLTDMQKIQKECEETGMPYINKKGIKEFLEVAQYPLYPLYYLDFETYNSVLPEFDGTRPYQTIPFQFSLHIVEEAEAKSKPKHVCYLVNGDKDPRPEFLMKLRDALGNNGSIIVFNRAFEVGVLKALAKAYPMYSSWIEEVIQRIIDLMEPFRRFYYYHPLQKGSISIKKILPTLTDKKYEGLAISDGAEASATFKRLKSGNLTNNEIKQVREDLENYCKLDTEAMILIMNRLKKLI